MKKILGIGNALTDIILQINDDNALKQLNLPKGSMQLVDEKKQNEISEFFKQESRTMITGGSASNTINGITRLGGQAGFIGKTGRDDVGTFYTEDSLHNGVQPFLLKSDTPSGRCLILVSSDGERTMCTYLGAASELEAGELHADMFEGYDIFHIEGYLVQNHQLLRTAMQQAKAAGALISIDLASYNVVEENIGFLKEILAEYVDIVFANEEEARAFTGKEPLEALDELALHARIAVVKIGKGGSYIKTAKGFCHVQALKSNCTDTTGAGDLYAAGFLYGMSRELPLEVCGQIGSIVAGHVVEVIGAKMSDDTWTCILNEINNLTGKN